MLITFELSVTPAFWDEPRDWPQDCRPIVFSSPAVMHNRGTIQVPAECADAVEQRLQQHPQVIAVARTPLPFPAAGPRLNRSAA